MFKRPSSSIRLMSSPRSWRVYEGQHPSIIAPELWDAVQAQLQAGGCQTKETHDEGPCSPFPTGRQALRRDRGPADAEPHQKEKRATAPLLRLPAPHPAQWPKGPLRLAAARPDAGTDRRASHPTACGCHDFLGLVDPHSDDARACLGASLFRRAVFRLCLLFIHPRAPNLTSLRSAGTMPA